MAGSIALLCSTVTCSCERTQSRCCSSSVKIHGVAATTIRRPPVAGIAPKKLLRYQHGTPSLAGTRTVARAP